MQVEEVLVLVARVVEGDAARWEDTRERAELPRLTLTYAQSIDGSIAAQRGKPTILSGASSMKMTHVLRTLHDGIMVGIGTILADNPSLNARLAAGKNPKPIIVDTHLQCPLGIKLFTNPTCEKPILLCAKSSDEAFRFRKQALEAAGAKILTCPTVATHIDLRQAFAQLRREGLSSVMVEGGASIILTCLQESAQAHLIDRVVVTVAPTFIGGLHAVGRRVSERGAFPRLVEPSYLTLDDDLVILAPMRRSLSISQANALANFDMLLSCMRNRRLVVFLDYDGTLTPIVSDPASALMPLETRATLQRLRQRFITGIISGRSLSKIQQFVGIPELYYAGSHGFDIAGPNGTAIKNQVAVEFLAHLEQIRDALMKEISTVSGAAVEDNIYSVSLHYRNVSSELRERVKTIAYDALSTHPQIKCNEGKMVYEFKPKIDWNKGKALVWLLQALGLDQMEDVFTIYIGDDTTDEDAFDVFRDKDTRNGVGIVVTDQSMPTGAFFTLHDTQEVFQFLNRLADLDADATQRSSTGSSSCSNGSTSPDR